VKGTRVRLEVADGIARVTLANAANRNAVDQAFCREYAAAGRACELDSSVRVILIQAEGEVFSVGGDINIFLEHGTQAAPIVRAMADDFHEGILAFSRAAAPVVLALNGMAAGGGFSIVCGADLVVAKQSAKLNAAYARTGLTPDGGGTWFLPRIVGLRRAFDLLATSPTLTARQALELGIVSRVVADEEFGAEVERIVGSLAAAPVGGLAALKALLRESPSSSLQAQLEAEAQSIAARAAAPESQQAFREFLRR
jgi:2-(1,2-epoxy-1,2-dihydrophenyl)acetyl-CoA isomerase